MNVTALPFAPFWEEQAGPNNNTVYSGTDYNTIVAVAGALNFTFLVLPTSSWAEVRGCRALHAVQRNNTGFCFDSSFVMLWKRY